MYKIKMTEMQKAYYLGRNEESNGGVGTHLYVELIYKGSAEVWINAFQKIINAQPILRAKALDTFEFEIQDQLDFNPDVIETDSNDESVIRNIRLKYEAKLYGRDDFPLFDMALVGHDNDYRVCFSVDMLIADGLSLYSLCRDLHLGVNGSTEPFENQEENLKYMIDYYYDRRSSKRYFKARDYYISKIDDLFPAPTMSYLEGDNDPTFGHLEFESDESLYQALNEKASQHNVSISDVVYTIYAMVLAKWSRYNDFSVNMTTFVRPLEEKYMKVFGDFTTSMLVQTSIDFDSDFYKNVQKNKGATFGAYKNSAFEVSEIVSEMNKKVRGVIMPVVYTSMLFAQDELNQDDLYIDYWRSQTPQVYLDCQAKNVNGKINITWDYRKAKFRESHINGMFDDIKLLLDVYGRYDIDIINWYKNYTNQAMNEMYRSYNKDEFAFIENDKTLCEMFKDTVATFPEKTFITIGSDKYSFREIYERSSIVAEELAELNKQNGKKKARIVFRGYKKIESMIYIVAAVLSRNSFCVLNKEYSEHKAEEILLELDNYIMIDENGNYICSKSNVEIPEDESYILFTSGTTGKPKGIVIEERAALNTVEAIDHMYTVTRDDVFINISNLYFDLSVYDIMSSMINGSEIVMVEALDSAGVREHLANITIWNSTPALVKEYAVRYDVPNIRLFLMSGDFVPKNLVEDLYNKYGEDTRIIALGGATEASIWSNYYDCKNYKEVKTIPYGRALSKQALYVVKPDDDSLCKENVVGEICIGGKGLARCYLDEEQTKEAFVYNKYLNTRIYKTGDLGYMGSDHQIYIIGRVAQEIKHNGYRIDLKEIENFIAATEGVSMAVVMLDRLENGRTRLLAVIESTNREIEQIVKNSLTEQFPYYMIPTQMVVTKKIPLTTNGKVDKKEMLIWFVGEDQDERSEKTASPATEVEKKLVEICSAIIEQEINLNSDFFVMGGNSIIAFRLLNQIKDNFKIDISLTELFESSIVGDWARLIQNKIDKLSSNEIEDESTSWTYHEVIGQEEEIKLLCFPHAGSSAMYFAAWGKYFGENIGLYPIQYPFRENRQMDLLPESLEELAKQLVLESKALFTSGKFALFGHCTGSIIAYEVAKYVKEIYNVEPVMFFASGNGAPKYPVLISTKDMPDQEFIELLSNYEFVNKQMFEDEEYTEYFLPIIRGDFNLQEKYDNKEICKLNCPIYVFTGDEDVTIDDYSKVLDWQEYTTDKFYEKKYHGGHFYIDQYREEICEDIINILRGR